MPISEIPRRSTRSVDGGRPKTYQNPYGSSSVTEMSQTQPCVRLLSNDPKQPDLDTGVESSTPCLLPLKTLYRSVLPHEPEVELSYEISACLLSISTPEMGPSVVTGFTTYGRRRPSGSNHRSRTERVPAVLKQRRRTKYCVRDWRCVGHSPLLIAQEMESGEGNINTIHAWPRG